MATTDTHSRSGSRRPATKAELEEAQRNLMDRYNTVLSRIGEIIDEAKRELGNTPSVAEAEEAKADQEELLNRGRSGSRVTGAEVKDALDRAAAAIDKLEGDLEQRVKNLERTVYGNDDDPNEPGVARQVDLLMSKLMKDGQFNGATQDDIVQAVERVVTDDKGNPRFADRDTVARHDTELAQLRKTALREDGSFQGITHDEFRKELDSRVTREQVTEIVKESSGSSDGKMFSYGLAGAVIGLIIGWIFSVIFFDAPWWQHLGVAVIWGAVLGFIGLIAGSRASHTSKKRRNFRQIGRKKSDQSSKSDDTRPMKQTGSTASGQPAGASH